MKTLKTLILSTIITISILITNTTPANTTVKEVNTVYTNDLITNQDLTNYAIQFLKDTYNIELDIPIYFNDIEQDNILGLFTFNNNYEDFGAIDIQINTKVMDSHAVERVLLHELTHYYNYVMNMDYEDGTEGFEAELYRNGGKSNYNNPVPLLNSKLSVECCD